MIKRILTWIQATSDQFHIWNYFGAVKPIIELSDKFPDAEIFLFTAIMHTYTRLHDAEALRKNVINSLKLLLACWADPKRFLIYSPADVPWHVQLSRILSCLTIMWTMERMHSYKDALANWKSWEIWVWTFCYPILMAADILIYDTDIVPVWKDQKQHLEYARDMAIKFNNQYWETFKIPDAYINEEVAIIQWIDGRKMSKSYNNYIWLLDDEKQVLKRVKQIPTNTQTVEESKNPDECNVYKILKLFLNEEENIAIRNRYTAWWLSYKEVKDYLYEKIIAFLKPIQEKYNQISDQEILDLLERNAKIVNEIANKKVEEVYKKIGFKL